jgi:biofilm PGA synthesis protein PgaA
MKISLIYFYCINIVLLFFYSPSFSFSTEIISHEQAVYLARSGELAEAVKQMENLREQQPENNAILHDLIVVYIWNGQLEKACALFEQQDIDIYPKYVKVSVQKAYRDLKKPEKALAIVNQVLEEQSDEIEFLFFKGLLLGDQRKLDAAQDILKSMESIEKGDKYFRLSAYIHAIQEDWLAALSDWQTLNSLLSQDQKYETITEQFSSLKNIFAVEAATNILNNHEEWFSDHDKVNLLINKAATKIRWSSHVARNAQEKYFFAMQALSLHIQSLNIINKEKDIKEWPTRLLNDLIIILYNMNQYNEIEQVYNYILTQGEAPEYVNLAFADVMLTKKRPKISRGLYENILKNNHQSHEALVGLFYSLIEERDFKTVYSIIDKAISQESLYQVPFNRRSPLHNSRYLDLNVYSILAHLYGGQEEEAWKRIDELVRRAPAHSWLFEVRGQTASTRGWPRQALDDHHHALLLDPDNVNKMAGKASALIHLNKYEQARPLLEFIRKEHPDSESGIRLEQDWILSRKPHYWTDVMSRRVSGEEYGNRRSMVATAEILSGPISDNLSAEVFCRYAWEETVEGEETFWRCSTGLNFRIMDWYIQGQATYNDSSLNALGAAIKMKWTPDDFWNLTLTGERFSVNTPLRALYHHIRSDTLSGGINYRWNEQRNLYIGIGKTFFTDDNKNIAGNLILTNRLFNIPNIDIDGRIELYHSIGNIDNDTPYFLPKRDYSVKAGLNINHIYFKHYEKEMVQEIDVGGGFYEQRGYETGWVGHIRYAHLYKYFPWIEMRIGVELGRNSYDGILESYQEARISLNWKF